MKKGDKRNNLTNRSIKSGKHQNTGEMKIQVLGNIGSGH